MSLRPLVVFDCVAHWNPTLAPSSPMSRLVIFSLWIGTLSNGSGGIGIGSTRLSGPSTVHMHFVLLQGTPIAFMRAPLPPFARRCQSFDVKSSEYTIWIHNETFCIVVSHSKLNPEICIWDLFTSWNLWKYPTHSRHMGQIHVTVSGPAIFRMVFSRHDLFDIWTGCILHVPSTTTESVLMCCLQCDFWLFWWFHAPVPPRSRWARSILCFISPRLLWWLLICTFQQHLFWT